MTRIVGLRFGEAGRECGRNGDLGSEVRPDKFYEIIDRTSESTSETLTCERSEWAARN